MRSGQTCPLPGSVRVVLEFFRALLQGRLHVPKCLLDVILQISGKSDDKRMQNSQAGNVFCCQSRSRKKDNSMILPLFQLVRCNCPRGIESKEDEMRRQSGIWMASVLGP